MIALQGVTKTYPNGTEALQPTDLQVAPGEFVTLLGPSGCGKSTLLRMVAGLLAPSSGQVAVQARQLAYVFQEPTLMPWARVQANVRLPLDLAGVPRSQADARVAAALAQVGLEGFAQHRPHELSGGMRMRVSIARGLVMQPDLLLMDEPFAALDEITRARLDDELLGLWRAGKMGSDPNYSDPNYSVGKMGSDPHFSEAPKPLTVLFVTHSIHEAVYLSQRVVVMAARPGRVIAQLEIDEPYPRDASFRVSQRFSLLAQQLHQALVLGHDPAQKTA